MTFDGFDLAGAIGAAAREAGVAVGAAAVARLEAHARAVAAANVVLHLTAIERPEAFVDRHIREAFEGAALLPTDASGTLVDLGSGNGYPGLPLSAARPGLHAVLVEASAKKAGFLRRVVDDLWPDATVLERTVQRSVDLQSVGPVRVLAMRAMGGWERIIPKLVTCLAPEGEVLLWAGQEAEGVLRREVWKRFDVVTQYPLAFRERSWIWQLRRSLPG